MDEREMKLEQLLVYGSKTEIIQNLKDAGCSQETVDCCLACLEKGERDELLKRLEKYI